MWVVMYTVRVCALLCACMACICGCMAVYGVPVALWRLYGGVWRYAMRTWPAVWRSGMALCYGVCVCMRCGRCAVWRGLASGYGVYVCGRCGGSMALVYGVRWCAVWWRVCGGVRYGVGCTCVFGVDPCDCVCVRAMTWQVYGVDALTKPSTLTNSNAIHYEYMIDCITYSIAIHSKVYITTAFGS